MGRVVRFKEAFKYIWYAGKIKNQTELAQLMKSSRSNISVALNGKESILTDKFLLRFNEAVGNIFSLEWLINGRGDMLNPLLGRLASNSTVTNVGVDISENRGAANSIDNCGERDAVDESEDIKNDLEPAPIIPSTWAKREGFNIAEAIEKHADKLYPSNVVVSGITIDAWYNIQDDSMSPHYLKGDMVAFVRVPTKKIVPGKEYVINTISHGLIIRVLYEIENGFVAHSYNNSEFPDFEMDMKDVINIFSVVCLVRI